MNIHHRNIKQISQDMQSWVHKHLFQYGIFECAYGCFNTDEATFLPIPMYYNWYAAYMEKSLDLIVATRLKYTGFNYWEKHSPLFKSYNHSVNHKYDKTYKLDIVIPVRNGYEMLVIGSHTPLSHHTQHTLSQCFHELSSTAFELKKKQPSLCIELRAIQSIINLQKHDESHKIQI